MKLDARRVPGFLRDPGTARVVLLHGSDIGLIANRAETLVRTVLGQADDPFRLAELGRDSWPRLAEEMTARALTGGRRVVRVREAGDGLLAPLQSALGQAGDTLVVIEGADLPSRSRLRGFVEGREDCAAVACYPEEGRALEETIRAHLADAGVTASRDALSWLVAHLGADQAGTRSEVEKLALYVGRGGEADLEAAQACVGDLAGVSLDDALFAATAGERARMERALVLALAEGAAPVGVLRAAMLHVQRLHRARLGMTRGGSAADAAKAARPPVFFKQLPAFTAALSIWPAEGLLRVLGDLARAELACKQTGTRDVVLCQRVLARIAEQAAARRTPGRG